MVLKKEKEEGEVIVMNKGRRGLEFGKKGRKFGEKGGGGRRKRDRFVE